MRFFRNLTIAVSALAFAIGPTLTVDVWAKDSSSSKSSSSPSSSKSSSPSSSGFSKPTSSAPTAAPVAKPVEKAATPPSSNNGFSKPGAPAAPVTAAKPAAPTPPTSALGTANAKATSASSLAAFQKERASAGGKPAPAVNAAAVKSDPAYKSASSSYGGNPNVYIERRTVVYNTYRTSHPEVFMYNRGLYPYYGVYDSGFLTGMMIGAVGMNMMQNAMWLSAQQSQPWYPAYRADLERQAAENAELRTKLALMDAQIAQVKASGQTVDPNKLPQGVEPAMAIAPAVVEADSTPEESSHMWLWILLSLGVVAAIATIVVLKRH